MVTRFSTFELAGTRIAVLSVPAGHGAEGLSKAESDVAALVARGLTNAQIARARGTSVRTVANQVRDVLSKLGVTSRREIAGALVRGGG